MDNQLKFEEHVNGDKFWYKNGLLHDVEYNDGIKTWYKNGLLHVVEYANRDKYYHNKDGFLHREDGPAVECNGSIFWYLNGLLHREDGPAIEYSDGIKKWYKKGKLLRGAISKGKKS